MGMFKVGTACAAALLALLEPTLCPRAQAQERIVKEVKIYSDVPGPKEADQRTDEEKYFTPFYVAPSGKAKDCAADTSFSVDKLTQGAKGTCIELRVNFYGPNEWAQMGFTPDGATKLGQLAGVDIAKKLGVGPNQKVFLEFKARRRADDNAVVSFRVGGLAGTPYKDSLRPPATRDPDFDELTADWKTFRIDLTNHIDELDSVLCPLSVTIETNRNPKAKPKIDSKTQKESDYVQVFVYLDDVRFISVADK